ncbi:MAG: hypothetical protein M3R27_15035, partial [Bacteroidota bacterium]|nr:hypothetical protein [Bacteroidota bacterium]
LILASSFAVVAQPPRKGKGPKANQEQRQEKKENIEAMKVAFLTNKLDLSPEEAQKFWPVYNQYTDKMQELRKKRKQEEREMKSGIDELSDKEVEVMVENEMSFREKELTLQKEYHSKFKSVLPIKKVAKLYRAEEQFKRVLLDKIRDKPVKE